MMLEGKRKCDKCGIEFGWYHIVSEPMTNNQYEVHTIPKNKQGVNVIEYDEKRKPSKISTRCPKCQHVNTFNI